VPFVWGYARVSREDQNLALQLDALEAAGVIQANIVEERESGAQQRPGFNALLKRLARGQPGRLESGPARARCPRRRDAPVRVDWSRAFL
jgi:DNA invertase Pin-like site-specific DNA recombinase